MKIKERHNKLSGWLIKIQCHIGCGPLKIYSPYKDKTDDLYEIGGVVATRAFWNKLFKRIGIKGD